MQWFYVELSDEQIALKNPLYGFANGTYAVREIRKIEFGYASGYSRPYIRVMTAEGWSRKRVVELVGVEQYQALIDALHTKGINVDTSRLQDYLKSRL